ncbi:molybdenum ABC transporter ATP-binding protein [Neorhizobium petrolearium]|uniref:Molybdenum ABC transporter ATP-binding protein n=1 Tax=Neorhizobium petrolearium TaxID=515361 RepID=A0ABY8MDN6_9HYPH|nr:molybdenum ABC transporter ATP-binding protein [Neorhizobium petrolearium]MCC2614051.1 molybdenum ABC transporter ATP-binding protein [Neorhizobium petrolearium]WGI71570.1 molybdenum ABC transporter ATP-binding protein [Neorhizobium petrolearium]
MTLVVEAQQKLGGFTLDAGFTSEGGVTALFGRSGSGKTSLIRVIAGLLRPDRGRLIIDNEVLLDTENRIFVPKHRRRFGYVFQEGRLFPHLTVRQNLVYGRWFASKAARGEDFDHIVDLLGIGALLDRRPGKLSGGEKQRVAIGRALLSAPRLLLMDEPLAALDEERKAEILPYLERLRDETTTPIVYVSHSVAEVARLADRVVMMRDGKVEAVGTPSDILGGSSLPSSDRREAGAVLSGTVQSVDTEHRLANIRLSTSHLMVPNAHVEAGRTVRVHIPERDVMVAIRRPEGLSALNILDGHVASMEPDGEGMVRIRIRCGEDMLLARITALSAERLDLKPGKSVFAVIKTVALER